MKIQSTPAFNAPTSLPQRAVLTQDAPAPQDKVDIQPKDNQPDPKKPGHFAGSKILTRMAGGAINGLLCNHFAAGSVGGSALVGAGVGAVYNGSVGFYVGAKAGKELADKTGKVSGQAAAIGGGLLVGGLGAGVGLVSGAAKGALIMALSNSMNAGPLGAAGIGAAISLIL